jgi:uncharacterized protein DUF1259
MAMKRSGVFGLALALAGLCALATSLDAADRSGDTTAADWLPVAETLGRAGALLPGGVYRVGLPRTDLTVTVQGVQVKPGFALGSYAAFSKMGSGAMVMGDLVLLDQEVNPVMSRLWENGLSVTALHNHLLEMSPHVMYMHFTGRGSSVALARGLRAALSASGTPLGTPSSPAAPADLGLPKSEMDAALGRSGAVSNGVLQFVVPRQERITEDRMSLLPGMGVATVMNVQSTGDGKAATTGDFVLVAREVNGVARALRAHGIQVTAIHQHALADSPRLIYMHFWAVDDAVTLARGLRAALDLTNSKKETPQ